MNKKQVLTAGTRVKRKGGAKEGAIIPDNFGICSKDQVLVEWDGSSNSFGTNWEDLEVLGLIKPEVDSEKCKDCIFFDGQRCHRYSAGRNAILFGKNESKRIPERIYPYCQSA